MPTDPHHHLDPDEDALAKMGYELEDVDYKKLGRSMFYFFGFVAFCGVAGLLIFGAFIGRENLINPPAQTAPFAKRLPGAGNPLLQTNVTVRTDIRDLRAEENRLLHDEPTWLDEGKGVVRLPIGQAIDGFVAASGGDPSEPTTIESGAPPAFAMPEHQGGAGAAH